MSTPKKSIADTIIVYNELLKDSVKRFHDIRPDVMNIFRNTPNIDDLEYAQGEVRNFLDIERGNLDTTSSRKFIYADYYAYNFAIISDLNSCHCWHDVGIQVGPPCPPGMTLEDFHKDRVVWYAENLEGRLTICTCSQNCFAMNCASVYNTKTGYQNLTGSCCLKKADIYDKNTFNKIAKTKPNYAKAINERKKELLAKKQLEEKELLAKKQLEELKLKFRLCSTCNKLKVPITEPKWKKECRDCYSGFKGKCEIPKLK